MDKPINSTHRTIKGIAVSPGISIGRAFVFEKTRSVLTGERVQGEEGRLLGIALFKRAVSVSIEEVEILKSQAERAGQQEGVAILETHIELLGDPEIETRVIEKIQEEGKNANDAVLEVIGDFVALFENMEDVYMSERAGDVRDIGNRILKHLVNSSGSSAPSTVFPQKFAEDTILLAEDLAPSDTISMDISMITGFATQTGGKTSHASIVAKSRGIPAIAGCGEALKAIATNDMLILDGLEGIILVNPEQTLLENYRVKREDYLHKTRLLQRLKDLPAVTTDGISIKLLANISGPDDMEEVFERGAGGVGLFRTELLFMGRDSFPDEEEQFGFYKKTALQAGQKPIIIRTLDIGGDKQLPYFGLPEEQNPFLGYRAIRICLDRKELFMTQLRAILRAGVFGKFKIMFPMISGISEIRAAKHILAEAKASLAAEGISYAKEIPVGIMIEIPSAAITADQLAKEVDFFSIGTNDLCQYTLAVDRMNEKIKDLYDPFNPGVLRLIRNAIEQGHKNNIEVGMCGEMASDPLATLLLAGMGLTEFSMSPSSIPFIKNILIHNSLADARAICAGVMEMDDSQNIQAYLQKKKAELQETKK